MLGALEGRDIEPPLLRLGEDRMVGAELRDGAERMLGELERDGMLIDDGARLGERLPL